tara:strand:- start:1297 stop:1626 length:330 start_codon:yes stop_codon:yes gene_type:complete
MKYLLIVVFFLFPFHAYTAEWNDKPVLCTNVKDVLDTIKSKKEILLYKAVQGTKVRTEDGLAEKPVFIPLKIYANLKTGTYTIVEFHSSYDSHCVISMGVKFNQLGKGS